MGINNSLFAMMRGWVGGIAGGGERIGGCSPYGNTKSATGDMMVFSCVLS